MKPGRQSIIMEIINEKDIETQNQLLEELAARGVKSTQATLSRDIRDMRLVKELGPNRELPLCRGFKAQCCRARYQAAEYIQRVCALL